MRWRFIDYGLCGIWLAQALLTWAIGPAKIADGLGGLSQTSVATASVLMVALAAACVFSAQRTFTHIAHALTFCGAAWLGGGILQAIEQAGVIGGVNVWWVTSSLFGALTLAVGLMRLPPNRPLERGRPPHHET